MTLTIELPPELERRLARRAQEQGIPAERLTVRLLEEHLLPLGREAELAALLRSWISDGDAQEHRETGDYLIRALDEDRLSDRPLFPAELEGITW
jgi:predicted transcriptional regulator